VATTGGALPEVVGTDGDTARTVPPADPSALTNAILDLLQDPEERARIGENGRRRVLERFTWRAHAQGLIDNWHALLHEHRADAHR